MAKQKQKKKKQSDEVKTVEKKVFFGKNFDIEQMKFSWKTVLLVLVLAYAFSIGVRFIWVYHFNSKPQFKWENQW